jgi:hypothetical protein
VVEVDMAHLIFHFSIDKNIAHIGPGRDGAKTSRRGSVGRSETIPPARLREALPQFLS